MRGKWDSRRPGGTYGSNTIAKAIADCQSFFQPAGFLAQDRSSTGQGQFQGDTSVKPNVAPGVTLELPPLISLAEPALLPLDALYGPIGRYVSLYDPHTEADRAAVYVCALAQVGNMMGRNAYIMGGQSRHYPNLFAVIAGQSAMARKGTAWQVASILGSLVDEDWAHRNIHPFGGSSGEGLIYHVRDKVEKTTTDKDGVETVIIADEGVSDKRMLCYESEFASILKVSGRDGNTLSATVRQAWDGGTLRTSTKNNACTATDPHISLVGNITVTELRQCLAANDTTNGFANRILWCFSTRSKILPRHSEPPIASVEALAEVIAAGVAYGSRYRRVEFSPNAERLFDEIYFDLNTNEKPGVLGIITVRSVNQIQRIALILAMLDQSAMIEVNHLTAARALWRYCEDSARFIFGSNIGDKTTDDIYHLIRTSPAGVSRTDIYKHFGNNLGRGKIEDALATLKGYKMVEDRREQTGGRPVEMWLARTATK